MIFFLLFLDFILFSDCTVYIDGPCPDVKVVENFNLTRFAQGLWYEIARYPNDWEGDDDCSYVQFDDDVGTTDFRVVGVYKHRYNVVDGYVDYAKNAGSKGIMNLRSKFFEGAVEKDLIPLYVLAIDYDKYIICYECKYDEATKKRHDFTWIDSRTRILDPETKKKITDFLKTSNTVIEKYLIWEQFTNSSCKIDN